MASKFKKYVVDSGNENEQPASNPVDGLSDQMAGLSRVSFFLRITIPVLTFQLVIRFG